VGETRQLDSEGQKVYTLWDLYPHAALVTYPSLYEGFGNAFLEAVYFRVPLLAIAMRSSTAISSPRASADRLWTAS
jgi:hypothetical protein